MKIYSNLDHSVTCHLLFYFIVIWLVQSLWFCTMQYGSSMLHVFSKIIWFAVHVAISNRMKNKTVLMVYFSYPPLLFLLLLTSFWMLLLLLYCLWLIFVCMVTPPLMFCYLNLIQVFLHSIKHNLSSCRLQGLLLHILYTG